MLFLTTTIWNVWFLRGVRAQGQRSDYELSGLPATREVGMAATAAGLGTESSLLGFWYRGRGGRFYSDFLTARTGGGTQSETGNKQTTEG